MPEFVMPGLFSPRVAEVRHGRACPGHPRSVVPGSKDVDARHKAGHDGGLTLRSVERTVGETVQFVLATRGGEGVVMNEVACSIAGPSGVGIFTQNGTRMRVPAIGANAISMLR